MKFLRGDRIRFSNRTGADYPANQDRADEFRDFSAVFGTPQGRRVLATILVYSRVWLPTYVEGDSHETARREGMRDVGLWLMETINWTPVDLPAATEHEEPDGL